MGDRLYASNYKGLNSLMIDLQHDNVEVYQNLLPNFKLIEKKRNSAIIGGGAVGIIGLTMIGVGFNNASNALASNEMGNPSQMSNSTDGTGLIFAGGIISLLGAAIYGLLTPNDNDIYNFINSHNKYNNKEKMEWEIGLNVLPRNTLGVALTGRF